MRNPDVPETLDGWSLLHRLYAFDRRRWLGLSAPRRDQIAREAQRALAELAAEPERDLAPVQVLGSKGDLLLVHYARGFEALAEAEARVDALEINDVLVSRSSYVSVLELGLYESSAKIHSQLRERELKPYSPAWHQAFDAAMAEQEAAAGARLWGKIPRRRYFCFYPMNKRRGEQQNWYALPYEERQHLMREHGTIGRSYHGRVNQVISGSIGFDDWEWGVDLYADDPLIFKRLIYEMRFDRASALYAEFGPFVTGLQFSIEELPQFLDARGVPRLLAPEPAAAH
ncbi:MAG: heme-dependent peroxidase [bacterium]|nr:heme-dependent peroxidase [bacterium]